MKAGWLFTSVVGLAVGVQSCSDFGGLYSQCLSPEGRCSEDAAVSDSGDGGGGPGGGGMGGGIGGGEGGGMGGGLGGGSGGGGGGDGGKDASVDAGACPTALCLEKSDFFGGGARLNELWIAPDSTVWAAGTNGFNGWVVTSSGTGWVFANNAGISGDQLYAIDGNGAGAIWAAGTYVSTRFKSGSWNQGPDPQANINGVVCLGDAGAVVVGEFSGGSGPYFGLYDAVGSRFISDAPGSAGSAGGLKGVWGGASAIWAVGRAGQIWRRDPSLGWAREDSGVSDHLLQVWGTASGPHLWAVGEHGRLLHSQGTGSWSAVSTPVFGVLRDVSGTGPNDVWVVGDGTSMLRGGATSDFKWVNLPVTDQLHDLAVTSTAVWTLGDGDGPDGGPGTWVRRYRRGP